MKPSVGRIVHYTNHHNHLSPELQAAIITRINSDGTVALHIFSPAGAYYRSSVPFTEEEAGTEKARGKWTWPARV